MDLGEKWNHVVRGGRVVKATTTPPPNPNPKPTPQPVTEVPRQPKVTATRKMAGPKKPEPKSTAATKPAAGKSKKKAAASVKTAAAKPTTPDLVVPTQCPTSPLEDISDLLDRLPLQACVELTRQLLTSISSLPTGTARPWAVLKTVILLVAEYGSTP
jgi:outer membrane biosynthesis protein TonB